MRCMARQGLVVVCTALILIGGFGCVPSALRGPLQASGPAPWGHGVSMSSKIAPQPPQALEAAPAESPAISPAGEPPEMTLERLIQIALENQPTIRSAQATRAGASARVGTARAAYFPSVGATMGYSRLTTNTTAGVSTATGNPVARHVTDNSVNNQTFVATINQNIFDSFRREWRVQAAREDFNASDLDLSTTRQNVILGVMQAYYNHLLALLLVGVSEESVNRNIQNLNRAQGFFEVGTRPKIDVTRAQVDVANAQLALVQARNQVATTLAALNNAIGMPDRPPYRLSTELQVPPETGSLEESIRMAMETRTELQSLQARIRSAEANLTLVKRNFLPSLAGDANWSYRGQQFPLAPNWLAEVILTVPVFTPPLFSQVDEAAANLASAQASQDITRQNIILEVRQSYLDLQNGRERISASAALLRQARENLDLAEGRYQVGVGPLIDVTDAQLAMTQAQSQNIQALVDFKQAESRLHKATGLLK